MEISALDRIRGQSSENGDRQDPTLHVAQQGVPAAARSIWRRTLMLDLSHLDWPFFDDRHRRFASELAGWADRKVAPLINHADVDRCCRELVRALGEAGWLKTVVPAASGGVAAQLEVRS